MIEWMNGYNGYLMEKGISVIFFGIYSLSCFCCFGYFYLNIFVLLKF